MTQTIRPAGRAGAVGPHNPDAPEVTVAPSIPASAGRPAAVPVTVRHRGRVPARLRVSIFGLDAKWAPAPLDLGVMQPGEAAVITLTIAPERGAMGASYPFTIAAESALPIAAKARPVVGVAESVLVLDAADRVSMALTPTTPSAVFSRRIRLDVTNPSSKEQQFSLRGDAAAGARLRLAAKSVTVPAQKTVSVRGRVKVRKPRVFGGDSTHTFTIAARGTGAPEWVEGTLRARPLVGKGPRAIIGVAVIVALWAALAVVFIPKISNSFKKTDTTTSQAAGAGAGAAGAKGAGGAAGASGGSGAGGAGAAGAGGAGANGSGTTSPAGGYQVTGTVTGSGASGASVTLAPVSLASSDDGSLPQSQSTDQTPKALRSSGSAFVGAGSKVTTSSSTSGAPQAFRAVDAAFVESNVKPAAATDGPLGKILGPLAGVAPGGFQTTTITTNPKGEFAFGGVTAPGYYLLTIAKAGYQAQRFLINSATLASPQPLKVDLEPGTGALSGTVTGPGGAIGAAQIVVTDGTVTLQTSSVSASTHTGTPGSWQLDQVSTPGTYLVTASSPGLGSTSKLVTLPASGSARVDLALVAGQASITGKVSGEDSLGNVGGLGGITVTATGGQTTRTATTVTSAAMRGSFVLPNLPAPGQYTLTITGAGFLTQTRDVTLGASGASVTVDATLSRADATVSGMVTGTSATGAKQGGLGGVGVTLASNSQTMKTMTTSGSTAGSFQFTGVAPGTYVLTAVQFGRVTGSATVVAVASTTKTVNLVLATDVGAELPATAHIRGQVSDSRTGGPLTCDRAVPTVSASDCVATVTVTAPKDPTDASAGTVTYTTTATTALNFVYTIPDLSDPTAGLPPGLYTVTVKAPGYEDTITHVEVAQGQTMPAPPASMPALDIISGTVTTRVGTPAKASCVLAVPVSVAVPSTLPTSCAPQPDGVTCTAPGISGAQPCALTSTGASGEGPVGTFTVPGLVHGKYQMVLISQDPEYVYTVGAVPIVTLPVGADGQFNAVLDRYGRIDVSVVKVDPATGALQPVAGAIVTAKKTAGDGVANAQPVTSGADGNAVLTGLNGTYQVTGTYTPPGGTAPLTMDATADPTTLNQSVNVTLVVAKQSGPIVGQVVTNGGNNSPIAVSGAVVTVSGVVGYAGSTASTGSATVTTSASGCYAIVPASWNTNDNGSLSSPACPAGSVSGTAVLSLKNSSNNQPATLITDRIDISVAAVPRSATDNLTDPYPVTGTGIADCATGCGTNGRIIPAVTVTASPISATGLSAFVTGPSGFSAPSASDVQFATTAKPPLAQGISITAASMGAPSTTTVNGVNATIYPAALTFTDSQLSADQALPGRYTVQVSAPGFVTQTFDIVCQFGSSTCITAAVGGATPTAPMMLRLPTIAVNIEAPTGGPAVADWKKATVSQSAGPTFSSVAIAGNGAHAAALTFNGSSSALAAAGGNYSFLLTVPGYSSSSVSVACGPDFATPPDGGAANCTATATLAPLPDFPTGAASGAAVALNPDTIPGTTTTLSPTAVTATISPNPNSAISIAVDANGAVTWTDSRPSVLPGQVVAGDYTITYHRAGFSDATVYLRCAAGTDCGLYADAEFTTQLTSATTLTMLPQPKLSVTIDLASPATAGASVDVSHNTIAAYSMNGVTATRLAGAQLTMTSATVDADGTTATANITWNDTSQAFPGIASAGSYQVTVALDGYQVGNISGIDCTVGGPTPGTCTGTATLSLSSAPQSAALIKLPTTSALASFTVTGGPAGAAPVVLTDSGTGLTWQQGNSPANVVTPGDTAYQISGTFPIPTYQLATVDPSTGKASPASVVPFTCDSTACKLPTLAFIQQTTLVVKVQDASKATVTAPTQVTISHGGSTLAGPVSTVAGAATFQGLATTAALTHSTPAVDPSYGLTVHAAGYAFADGLSSSSDSTVVTCTNSGGSSVDGVNLIPGGTTTCTVTLSSLGSIPIQTNWALPSPSTVTSQLGSVSVTATMPCPTGDTTGCPTGGYTFTGTSNSSGGLTLTGSTSSVGLQAGSWTIKATASGYATTTGTVTINSAYQVANATATGTTGAIIYTSATAPVTINLQPNPVTLQVHMKNQSGNDFLPQGTLTLSGNNTQTSCAIDASGNGMPTSCVTNSQGNKYVVFTDVYPGITYSLNVTPTNNALTQVQMNVQVQLNTGTTATATQSVPVSLSSLASTLTGRITDGTNSIPDATVFLSSKSNNPSPIAGWNSTAVSTTTSTNGTFTLTGIPNSTGQGYYLVVQSAGYVQYISTAMPFTTSGTPNQSLASPVQLTRNTATVNLKVTSSGNINGATVTLQPVTPLPGGASAPTTLPSGTIGASGAVSSLQVPSGTWTVSVSAQGNRPFTTVGTSITVQDSDNGKTLTPTVALAETPQALTASWTPTTCAVAPAAGTTVPLSLSDGTTTAQPSATVSSNSATATVYLPSTGSFTWNVSSPPAGWTAPTDAVDVSSAITLSPVNAPVSVKVQQQGTDGTTAGVTGATLSILDSGGNPVHPTVTDAGSGSYTTCLAIGTSYKVTSSAIVNGTLYTSDPATSVGPVAEDGSTTATINLPDAEPPAPTLYSVNPPVTLKSGGATPGSSTTFTVAVGGSSFEGSFAADGTWVVGSASANLAAGDYTPDPTSSVTATEGTATISGSFTVGSTGTVTASDLQITYTAPLPPAP